jgi:hypothetical protein
MGKREESQAVLKSFGLPPAQQGESAAYTLLALAGLAEQQPWAEASRPLLRIHDILQFAERVYGKRYAENSRETFRKSVLHQFVEARIVDRNPDDHSRPTNSGKTCYALTQEAQAVVTAYGTAEFLKRMKDFQKRQPTLKQLYRTARERHAVEVELPEGVKAFLSPGLHNELEAAVIHEFWPRFIRPAKLLYLGDTAKKDWHVDHTTLEEVGLPFSVHDKFPDLVFWWEERRWLILVEAFATTGPFTPKRKKELENLLRGRDVHCIFVTAFPSWEKFKKEVHNLAWDTEVWIAEKETLGHMIHFNGPKFLAPTPHDRE